MKDARYFQVVVACGHVGAGREIEISRYLVAPDLLAAYDIAKLLPRSKKNSTCIKIAREISVSDYLAGKAAEKSNPYLQVHKTKGGRYLAAS